MTDLKLTKYQKALLRRSLLKLKIGQKKQILNAIGRLYSAHEQTFLDVSFVQRELLKIKKTVHESPTLTALELAKVLIVLHETMSMSKKSKEDIKFMFDCLRE